MKNFDVKKETSDTRSTVKDLSLRKTGHDKNNKECRRARFGSGVDGRIPCTCLIEDGKYIKIDPQMFKDGKFEVKVEVSPRIDYCC